MNIVKPGFRSVSAQRSGAAVVEFAVILPLFVLLLMGTIEICSMIFLQQSLEIAAYEAARVSIVPGTTKAQLDAAASDIVNARRVYNTSVLVIPANFQSATYGTFIRVEVSAPCNSNAFFALRFFGSKTLTGTVEMMKEFDP